MSWAVLDELDFDVVASDQSVAVSALERVSRVTAHGDPATMSTDELLESVGAVQRSRRYLDATDAHALAELDRRGVTVERRGLRTGQWVALETHGSIPAMTRWVGQSVRMGSEFPAIDQALTDGVIERSHVEVLLQYWNERIDVPYKDKLPYLIGLLEDLPFKPWQTEVARVAARLDFDGGYRPDNDAEMDQLFIDRLSGDDVTLIRGAFIGESGTTVAQIVSERADQIRRRYQRDHKTTNGAVKIPKRPALLAEAFKELILAGLAADPTNTHGPVTDLTIVLHLNVGDFLPDGMPAEGILMPDGTPVTGASLQTLFTAGRYTGPRLEFFETFDGCEHCGTTMGDRLCDPAITFLTMNAEGMPLNLGRTQRFASEAQRKAAKIRDGGCVFPGCDRPGSWCDCHHVEHFGHPDNPNGGPTDIGNLACLCRFHHGVTHKRGWQMFATKDQWFWWITPNGDTFWSQRNGIQHPGPAPNAP